MPTGYEIYGPLPWKRPVESVRNDPPTNPNLGESHIIGGNPTGEWVGRPNQIARWSGQTWKYDAPVAGWITYIKSGAKHLFYGTSWEDFVVPSGSSPVGQIDGGTPTSEFGGTEPIDSGGV